VIAPLVKVMRASPASPHYPFAAQTVTSALDRLDEGQRREIRDRIFQIDLDEFGGHHGAGDAAA
jgi:hypothetical protein